VHKNNLSTRRLVVAIIIGSLGTGLMLATAGCHHDDTPPASTGYYTGPMQPKAPRGGAGRTKSGGAPGRTPSSDL
jgi:hypothetical protein